MLLFETIDRLSRIHRLIKREGTGTPDEFAERFHLKRRQLYNILDEFKDFGAEIRYSRIKNSFYYTNDFDVNVNISVNPLSENENISIIAGCCGVYKPFVIDDIGRFFSNIS